MPDSSDSISNSSAYVPTGMENDPNADEEVINQQDGEEYPNPVLAADDPANLPPDKLADSIAYALDGSGSGLTNDTPNVAGGHKVITEGVTGAGLDEEEENLEEKI